MSTYGKEFDSEKRVLLDEAGMMPLMFRMNGSKFRWDVLKMAYEMSHPKSLERITRTAQEIIDWVNDEQKTPQLTENQPKP